VFDHLPTLGIEADRLDDGAVIPDAELDKAKRVLDPDLVQALVARFPGRPDEQRRRLYAVDVRIARSNVNV
jgi:hypothetical protein